MSDISVIDGVPGDNTGLSAVLELYRQGGFDGEMSLQENASTGRPATASQQDARCKMQDARWSMSRVGIAPQLAFLGAFILTARVDWTKHFGPAQPRPLQRLRTVALITSSHAGPATTRTIRAVFPVLGRL